MLTSLTAHELGSRYRSGEATPTQAITEYLARIEALDPQVRAFLTVTRESGSALRGVYDAVEGVRVFELQGDLLFAGAEQVLRTIERESDEFDVAILEVSRIDDINDAARSMLAGMRATLTAAGKEGFLVDPDDKVVPADSRTNYDAVVFQTLDDALYAAQRSRA